MAMPRELQGTGPVSLAEIRRLIQQGDLEGRWHTLAFLRDHSNRVRPAPNDEWLRDELFRYYVDSIRANLKGHDVVHSRYEAAGALVPLFEWLISGNAGGTRAAKSMATTIEELFRSNTELRNCIETGFLEHVLEVPDAIPYFAHWQHDSGLVDSYHRALAWGSAHVRPLPQR